MDHLVNISAEELDLKPVGADTGGAPDSVLKGNVVLAGCTCHVQAVQVTVDDNGVLTAVNQTYQSDLDALYELSGDSLTTATIMGKQYAMMAFPYAA